MRKPSLDYGQNRKAFDKIDSRIHTDETGNKED